MNCMLAANLAFMIGSLFLYVGTLLSTLTMLGVVK